MPWLRGPRRAGSRAAGCASRRARPYWVQLICRVWYDRHPATISKIPGEAGALEGECGDGYVWGVGTAGGRCEVKP